MDDPEDEEEFLTSLSVDESGERFPGDADADFLKSRFEDDEDDDDEVTTLFECDLDDVDTSFGASAGAFLSLS